MASTVWKGYITFGLITIPVRYYADIRPAAGNPETWVIEIVSWRSRFGSRVGGGTDVR